MSLAKKWLNSHGKIKLGNEACKQYEITAKEVNKLCDLSGRIWALADDKMVNEVLDLALIEGICYGVVIGGMIYIGSRAYTKLKRKSKTL